MVSAWASEKEACGFVYSKFMLMSSHAVWNRLPQLAKEAPWRTDGNRILPVIHFTKLLGKENQITEKC